MAMYRVGVGKVQDYGLPEPDHKIGEAHPTISADFLNRIAHGEMTLEAERHRARGRAGPLRGRHAPRTST